MKTLRLALLLGSLVFNVALVGLLVAGSRQPPAAKPAAPTRPVPAARTGPVLDAGVWAGLRNDDLKAMVKQMRDGGFPPDVVRAIMAAQIRETFAARLNAIDPARDSRPFWKNTTVDPRVQQAQSQLYREQRQLLRELLGADADPREDVNAIYQGRRMDSVPADKVDDVRRLLREYDEARSEAFSGFSGGMFTPDLQRKLAAVDRGHQDALAQILSPAELDAYNLRNSDTARQLRGTLSAFNPTEDEFRSLYRLQAEFDDRFGRIYSVLGPDEQRRRSEAQRQLNDQIKAVLGPVRGAEYELSTDYSYRQTSQLVARLELPPDTTAKIWELKKEFEQRAGTLQRDSSLTNAARNQQLSALENEGAAKLAPLLGGPRGVEAFRQYGGSWLKNLAPRPALPSSGTLILSPGR